jgi:hypothetical protein
MSRLFCVSVLAALAGCTLLVSCQSPTSSRVCPRRHEVHLGVTNNSLIDTLAFATVAIDDSVVFACSLLLRRLSTTHFQRVLRLCDGPHRVNAHVGRYAKDTVLSIHGLTSLFVDMDHETAYTDNNGLNIVTLIRDGDPNGNSPD